MDTDILYLLIPALLVLLAIAFFAVFRGKGKIRVETPFGRLEADGENSQPPGAMPAGVKVSGQAGGDIRARSTSEGGVEVNASAGGSIEATHQPGSTPPKA